MNPVLILSHNCLELTKKCVESVARQDVETTIYIEDNDSSDGTREWLKSAGFNWCFNSRNEGVSWAWNDGLGWIFHTDPSKWVGEKPKSFPPSHCLVLNNDVIIPRHFLRELLSTNSPFVTGVSWGALDEVMGESNHWQGNLTDGPDFSAFLIRREAWEKIGPFNESMVHYCQDLDYDIRARRLGMVLHNSHIKFYHERSSTLRHADIFDQRKIQKQAEDDRKVFKSIYGCSPFDPQYADLFK
jgi:GT2 family glycosyltransferase